MIAILLIMILLPINIAIISGYMPHFRQHVSWRQLRVFRIEKMRTLVDRSKEAKSVLLVGLGAGTDGDMAQKGGCPDSRIPSLHSPWGKRMISPHFRPLSDSQRIRPSCHEPFADRQGHP